jgi:glucose-1-phosphate thymidylyltransferase
MKGILLAGGTGSRLAPLTAVVNKHLLPVYDKPMILYPLQTLRRAGLCDVMMITGGEHIGRFIEFIGDGSRFNTHLTYRVQEKAGGIAEALGLCEEFAGKEDIAVILGDNIFSKKFMPKKSKYGCTLFLKEIDKAASKRFGCALVEGDKVVYVEEKPLEPKSNLAITGYYIFSSEAFELIKGLEPSKRGELEITDVINSFVQKGDCGFAMVESEWSDAGTFDSLLHANNFIYEETKTL